MDERQSFLRSHQPLAVKSLCWFAHILEGTLRCAELSCGDGSWYS